MTRTADKRRHPRVAHRIQVRSEFEGELQLETIDLSAGGLNCSAPVYLAPMTKMALSLVLPPNHDATGSREHVVRGEAVVVRTEPAESQGSSDGAYRVALFFTRMEESDRARLLSFLKLRTGNAGRSRN